MNNTIKRIAILATAGVVALMPSPASALTQNETVYVKLQPSGATDYISVIEHLKNDLSDMELFDQTILENLENLNGFEGFTIDGNNVKWDAQGKDIFYRGTTRKDLPVQLKVLYKLNGEEKPLEEMLGQAGQVEINLHYTNFSKVGDLYTPFMVAVATKFDSSLVSNVTVTNGKAITNGRTVAVTAVAAPGLYESLGLEELKGSDEVTISFDTSKFELGDIYSVITPELLGETDLRTFTELDELYTKTNQLANSSQQLVNGTVNLNQGIVALKDAVIAAKTKLQKQQASLNQTTLNNIKSSAQTAAIQNVQAQSGVIQQQIIAKLGTDPSLVQLLTPAAQNMCQANPATASLCDDPTVLQPYLDGIMARLGAALGESSLELAQSVASQTASSVAESVATKVSSSVQDGITNAVINALDEMLAGIEKLQNGSADLQSGMARFNNEGIKPLANFVNGKVRVTTDKVERLIKLAEQYDNYAGIADGANGTTKFVLMIEEKR